MIGLDCFICSFVFNGFLKFLLREEDPRALALRRRYVFKLIPMLNPDGVFNGHYRTDTRGVNLNRVYQRPSPTLHPSIFAARRLLLYAHDGIEEEEAATRQEQEKKADAAGRDTGESEDDNDGARANKEASSESVKSGAAATRWLRSSLLSPAKADLQTEGGLTSSSSCPVPSNWYEMTETSRFSEGDESIADFSTAAPAAAGAVTGRRLVRTESGSSGGGGGSTRDVRTSFKGAFSTSTVTTSRKLNFDERPTPHTLYLAPPTPALDVDSLEGENSNFDFARKLDSTVEQQEKHTGDTRAAKKEGVASVGTSTAKAANSAPSNVFLYVDVHGHASKRGIFMYGNHFVNADLKVDSMLLPKLMSINCANFDFPACNFTERNMYLKDRHTGAGREGSGRVSAHKATGLVYSYTLECNFNTGRIVNSIPMASRDAGRATPPPLYNHPPK